MQWVQDSIVKQGWAGVSSKNAITDLQAGAVSATISSSADLAATLKAAKEANMRIGVGFLPGAPPRVRKFAQPAAQAWWWPARLLRNVSWQPPNL